MIKRDGIPRYILGFSLLHVVCDIIFSHFSGTVWVMRVRGNRGRRAENGTQIGHLNGADSGVNFVQWNEEAYLRALMEGKEEEEEEERSLCIFTFPTFSAHHAFSQPNIGLYLQSGIIFLPNFYFSLIHCVGNGSPPYAIKKILGHRCHCGIHPSYQKLLLFTCHPFPPFPEDFEKRNSKIRTSPGR